MGGTGKMTESSNAYPLQQGDAMTLDIDEQIAAALRADLPAMPDDVAQRLLQVIASEHENRRVANGNGAKPDPLNPPTHYDKSGLGMRESSPAT